MGYGQSGVPKQKSLSARVFWNTVGFSQRDSAMSTEFVWPM